MAAGPPLSEESEKETFIDKRDEIACEMIWEIAVWRLSIMARHFKNFGVQTKKKKNDFEEMILLSGLPYWLVGAVLHPATRW